MRTPLDTKPDQRNYDAPGNADASPWPLSHAGGDGSHDDLGMPEAARTAEREKLERLYNTAPHENATRVEKGPEADAPSLRDREEAGSENPGTGAAREEADQLQGWYRGQKQKMASGRLSRLITRKRALLGGGITGLLVAGGLGAVFSSVPSLQAIHYSQILQGAFRSNTASSNTKIGRLYQYMRTGNVGSTRLSYLEYKLYPRMITSFNKTGVSITTEKLTGQIRAISLDPSKLSDMSGMNREQAKAYLSERYGVNPAKIYVGSEGGNIRLVAKDMTLKQRELFIKDIVRQSGAGKISAASQKRLLRKFYNVPSMFHPIQRLDAAVDKKQLEILRKSKRFRELEQKRSEALRQRTPEANARLERIKGRLGTAAGVTGAVLIGTSVVCVAYDIALEADALNIENYIEPSVRSGMDGVAVGDQVAADSPDVSGEAVEAYNENFYDPATKTTPFDSAAIQALQGQAGGVPAPKSLVAAFSPDSSANILKTSLENDYKAGSVCSTFGQVLQGVAGITLTVLGPGGWLLKGITVAGGAVAGQAVMNLIQSTVPELLAEEPPIGIPHMGATGGAFDAFGVMKAANDMLVATGGVQIDTVAKQQLEQEIRVDEQKEFAKTSLAHRFLDPSDYRSLAGRLASAFSPNLSANSAVSFVQKAPQLIGKTLVRLPLQRASAATTFDWGMPSFGPMPALFGSQQFADPYTNADRAAQVLDGPNGQGYIDKAYLCFGARIAKATGETGQSYWDVVVDQRVNTNSSEYRASDCGDSSDENWVYIVSLVAYTPEMEWIGCWNGRDDSCERVGVNPLGALLPSPSSDYARSHGIFTPPSTGRPPARKNSPMVAKGALGSYALRIASALLSRETDYVTAA